MLRTNNKMQKLQRKGDDFDELTSKNKIVLLDLSGNRKNTIEMHKM